MSVRGGHERLNLLCVMVCVHPSATKLSHVSLSRMIIAHNCSCAVIDVPFLHKHKPRKTASSGTFASNETKTTRRRFHCGIVT